MGGRLIIHCNDVLVTVTEKWLFEWGGGLSIGYKDVVVTVTEMWLFVWGGCWFEHKL